MGKPLTGDRLVNWAWDEWMGLLSSCDTPNETRQALWQLCDLFGVREAIVGEQGSPTAALQRLATRGPLTIRARAALGLIQSGELDLGLDEDALGSIRNGDTPS